MKERKVLLPIKVVTVQERDWVPPGGGGGDPKMFGEVTKEIRESLISEVESVYKHFADAFQKHKGAPAVARVTLKPKALAKSHRPDAILNKTTCPIIGANGFGELLVSVQPQSLELLADQLRMTQTKDGIAAVSTIQKISPYSISEALGFQSLQELSTMIDEDPIHPHPLKLRLFHHKNLSLDTRLLSAFREKTEDLGIPMPESIFYAQGMQIYRIPEMKKELLEPLASFLGTQRLSTFPRYQVLKTSSIFIRPVNIKDFPPPEEGTEYPFVGLIDSGTDPSNSFLSKWIADREVYVADGYTDFEHGTFVAGLLIHPSLLNSNDPPFPDISSKIVDVVAVPEKESLYENELMWILEDVLPKHREVKVWNLSLAMPNKICQDDTFSDMAIFLDRLQDQYGVLFVVACGNYDKSPLRSWPPQDLGEADRICAPADSVRAISVGSIAHLHKPNSCVKTGNPSPFSRRGPGPVYLPKPELTLYGGNCDKDGDYLQTGIISLGKNGGLAENIGTSFSTPIACSLLANIGGALSEMPSINLMKALIIHSARLSSPKLTTFDLRYKGFGTPSDLPNVLTCEPWSATLIFEPEIFPGKAFEKTPFPIPQCLKGPRGTLKAEIVVTVVYDPPLDPSFGSEYCRRNIDVSFGTYDVDKDGKRKQEIKIPSEPEDINQRYEENLIKYGFKWSPVKAYRKSLVRVSGDQWRLYVKMTDRKEFFSNEPQRIALVFTILDPERRKPVYDEVVRWMNREGWITADLRIKEQIQVRA